MASVDAGSRSIQISSDEIYDHVCGPCKTDGTEKEARHYCQDCGQNICDARKDYHRKLAGTRNHLIVPVDQVTDPARGSLDLPLCNCNNNQQVVFYCDTHEDVICSPCKSFQHHKCYTSIILMKSSGYKFSAIIL